MSPVSYAFTQPYPGSFDQAVTQIIHSLKQAGFGILTQIDVKKTLKQKLDVNYSNYIILGVCNPPNAYQALQAEKEIGLLLPCNVLVYEEDDKVVISIIKPTVALTLSNNPTIANIAKQVETKLTRALHQATNQ